MLINLSPKSSFRTEMERRIKMVKRCDDGFKFEKFKFDDLFRPTEVKGIYFSDCENEYMINCWAKQRTIYRTELYWKNRHNIIKSCESVMQLFDYETNIYDYGFADSIQQIVDYYNNGIMEGKFKGNHVILLKKVVWHKWGQYIDNQNRHYKYLNDEPDVTETLCYRIYKVI